ncbi:hypothetical protein CC117_21700 [Parafrankia colletiae]|uniref:Uncharacterized protein n=1 Tax=Parafrankia colletiae TaxID=573497 RepID=A0A1S1QJW2_9ACTN|nr:DUF4286 family protein [Parafrankia colletiae]MCK9899885.1 hypothetical protein [Frankia sp. Cpl3]OHV34250.1 hypothetical protein CC117_21700 [Parafrankia colletiae]
MPRGVLIAQSSPVSAELEEEYNRWYDEDHIPGILQVPGFLAARRYHVREAGHLQVPPGSFRYLTIYEIETDDVDAMLRELRARSADGRVPRSRTVAMQPPPTLTFYELRG